MFIIIRKQVILYISLLNIITFSPVSLTKCLSQDDQGKEDDFYFRMNEKEKRLAEFRDDDSALNLKIIQLGVINRSRKKFNAPPVKLDILASRVANKMCSEAAREGYIGHWNLAGEEPYLRYAFAGGQDHISENIYGEWSSEPFGISDQAILSGMKEGHMKFMAEKAPANGHKMNIIEKSHNWIGIGFAVYGKQFRYSEEFIDRYLDFENIPEELKPGEKSTLTIKPGDGNFLYFMIIYRQKFPEPVRVSELNRRGSYRDFTDEQYKTFTAWELSKFRNGDRYLIPVSFSKEGLYYIQIYSDRKEITRPASISTKGKTPESGIVIKVR